MPDLYLPKSVLWNAERERLTARHSELQWFDAQLREIDPHLSLVKAGEDAVDRDLVPGHWHIKRTNPIGMDTYLPISGPDGEFMEPHSGVLDRLKANDLQRPGRMEELRKEWDRADAARARSDEADRADRMDEFAGRYKAHAAPGVLFGDNKWTWRTAGRRGATA